MGDHQGKCKVPGIALFVVVVVVNVLLETALNVARKRSFLLKEVSTVVHMEHTLWTVG